MEHKSQQSKPNIAKAAREMRVPYQRFLKRWKGRKSLFERDVNGRKLDPAQEKALCSWIDYVP
jgi:hypothetical protein